MSSRSLEKRHFSREFREDLEEIITEKNCKRLEE
jgi:hypothetical protein